MHGAPFSGLGGLLGGDCGFPGHYHGVYVPPGPPVEYSIEFGRDFTRDYVTLGSMPAGNGFLFSAWVRIPEQIPANAEGYQRGNINVFEFLAPNWGCVCIGGNGGYSASNGNCFYNVNSMFGPSNVGHPGGSYLGYDQTWYLQEWLPLSYMNNFVFLAWQMIIGASNEVIIRQWIKYLGQPILNPQESILTLAQVRTDLVANAGWTQPEADAWTPQLATSVRIGTNNGMFAHARAEANTSLPSNAYMESIAALTSADTSAWGDWQLNFNTTTNQPNLTDRSGNGRTLVVQPTGTLYQGPVFP